MNCPTCHKPTPADSVHTCSPVPLLTKSMAALMKHYHLADEEREALIAIESGRVACHDTQSGVFVPYMSEDYAMAMCAQNAGSEDDYAINLDGYLAALRDLGIVKP